MAFYERRGFLYLKNMWIGIGAGFIILGALFKILHWPYANEILMYAMIFEASIFFLQAIIPPHRDYHWEKLFPGLDKVSSKVQPLSLAGLSAPADPVANELNKQLSKAGVDKALIGNLGKHLNVLGDNLGKLGTVTNVAGATGEYTKNANAAAKALGEVSVAYKNAAGVAQGLTTVADDTRKYQEQVKAVSKNLAALNAVYELELQDTNNHLKAMNKFYGNLTNAIENLNESVADTKKYREQMGNLATNLSTLNNVYGNMLSAMSMSARTTSK